MLSITEFILMRLVHYHLFNTVQGNLAKNINLEGEKNEFILYEQ